MAYIRDFAAMSGDPRTKRRHFSLHKLARRFHGISRFAGFIPGVSQIENVANLVGMSGDPGPPRRKMSGAGPHAKAQQHTKNLKHQVTHKGHGKKKGKGGHPNGKGGIDLHQALMEGAGLIPGFGGVAQAALQGAHDIDHPDVIAALGGKRRHKTRVINVTALNRAAGRIKKFEKLVHRLTRRGPLKKLMAPAPHHGHAHPGHKAGCRCAACSHR